MFNFKNGTALAVQQDLYIKKYLAGEKISAKEIGDMEQDLWVVAASKLAPGNLVIRQWALIDLFRGTAGHFDVIYKMMDTLTYKGSGLYRLWSESYSYFGYTMDILKVWVERFEHSEHLGIIKDIVDSVNQGFIATSYFRDGLWYPAPYGDLREIPLGPDLQISHEMKTIKISNVILNYVKSEGLLWYSISGWPLGCNTHIPKGDSTVKVMGGIPFGFKFYEGYDKKYRDKWDEYRDTFDPRRLLSIIKL